MIPLMTDGRHGRLPARESVHGYTRPVLYLPVTWTLSAAFKICQDSEIWSTFHLSVSRAVFIVYESFEWQTFSILLASASQYSTGNRVGSYPLYQDPMPSQRFSPKVDRTRLTA
eukprot:3287928-Rhodomonas_salina.3